MAEEEEEEVSAERKDEVEPRLWRLRGGEELSNCASRASIGVTGAAAASLLDTLNLPPPPPSPPPLPPSTTFCSSLAIVVAVGRENIRTLWSSHTRSSELRIVRCATDRASVSEKER